MPNKKCGVRACAAGLGILGLCLLWGAAEEPGPYEPPIRNEAGAAVLTPETAIQGWPEASRAAARALIEKYGEPNLFDRDSLSWDENAPWARTIVYREAPLRDAADGGRGVVKQAIVYDVPQDKAAALARFDGGVESDRETGELSSRSSGESLNYLALNLADEIVRGKRGADEARDFYRKTVKLSAAGKSSPYLEGFLFPQSGERKRPFR